MPGAIEGAVFAILASNAVTFPLAGSALAISAISSAVTAGLYLGATALLAPSRNVSRPDQAKESIQIPDASLMVLLGRGPTAGSRLFGNSVKEDDDNNLFRHQALCAGPIDAFEEYYISKRPVIVESDGAVSSPPYARVSKNYAHLYSRFGEDPETAFARLVTAFPDLYTADHRGDALAQMLGVFTAPDATDYLKIFPNGKPEIHALVRGKADIYDPRTGLEAWTDNGPLCVLHFLTMPAYMGWGLPTSLFDMDDIAETADAADLLIPLKEGGTEKRSRCGGVYSCDRPRGEILADLLLSTGTRIVRLQNGLFSIRLEDDDPEPELIIPTEPVEEFDWSSGPESVERPNRMVLKYFPPEQDYNITELSLAGLRWGEDLTEISRVGERVNDVALNFCQWHGQASRITRRLWYTRRAQRGQVITNLYGLGALGRTYATIPVIGTSRTMRGTMVQPRLEEDGLRVSIPFVESPTLPEYDPALDQADAPDQLPDAAYSGNVAQPDVPTEATQVEYPDTSREIRVRYPAPGSGLSMEANFRSYTTGNPNAYQSMTEVGSVIAYIAGDEEGQQVDFRVRQYDGDGEVSLFSDLLAIPALAIDNTVPGSPAVIETEAPDGATLDITVPELRVVKVLVEYNYDGGGWTPHTTLNDVRTGTPRQVILSDFTNGGLGDNLLEWRVSSFTSNGTQGAYASGSVIIFGA